MLDLLGVGVDTLGVGVLTRGVGVERLVLVVAASWGYKG